MLKKSLLLAFLVIFSMQLKSQESDTTKKSFSLNADLVSRYIWRGQIYSSTPNIQPYASFTKGQFTFGTWGSYALADKYSEIDFYVTWEYKNFSLSVFDYCTLEETWMLADEKNNFFSFRHNTTPHATEGVASYTISESFPLKLTAATFFYGGDQDDDGGNLYSTYLELSYPFSVSGYDFNVFAGGTPTDNEDGYYGEKAGMVNMGLSATKNIKISDSYEIPAMIQFVANPVAEDAFLVFSLTF
jgi:hypothetical protein